MITGIDDVIDNGTEGQIQPTKYPTWSYYHEEAGRSNGWWCEHGVWTVLVPQWNQKRYPSLVMLVRLTHGAGGDWIWAYDYDALPQGLICPEFFERTQMERLL